MAAAGRFAASVRDAKVFSCDSIRAAGEQKKEADYFPILVFVA
jgi:hypothetical protein